MKNKNIFFFGFVSVLVLVLLNIGLIKLYDYYVYRSLNQMVYVLETNYPDLSTELMESLMSEEEAVNVLSKYGLDVDTLKHLNFYQDFRLKIVFLVTFSFLLNLIFFFLVQIQRNKKIKKEIGIINQYLQDILSDHYELNIAQYNEDELSVLKNDIYKVTIKLKELSAYEQKEQQFLMNTLEDISHQLKTPLTALMITNDILANNELSEDEKKEFLAKQEKELEKMEWLITTLLKLRKLDSGTVKFKYEKILSETLLDEALESLQVILELKHVRVMKKHLDFYLFVDVSWMREALTNILKNACEHVGDGGEITITGDDNPLYKSIEIKDNGIGIKKSDIKNIFKRFYSTSSSKNSMGIGLNMAKIIIEKHNGKIEVDSEVGKYTTFKIIFMKKNC